MYESKYECMLFNAFCDRLLLLKRRVIFLKKNNPDYTHHATVKLFIGVCKVIRDSLVEPANRRYELGPTLGPSYTHWRRCKKGGLPDRYRLFFQFRSDSMQCVYAWLNDEKTLRNDGAKTDVYAVFKMLLEQHKIPDGFAELVAQSKKTESDFFSS